jgi:hypothetical protein
MNDRTEGGRHQAVDDPDAAGCRERDESASYSLDAVADETDAQRL